MTNTAQQTVLITGASAGIGAALAREFARHGHHLILVARSADKLDALAAELTAQWADQHGSQYHCLPADLTEPKAAQQLFETVSKQGLSVDILVNNAGLVSEGAFHQTALDDQLAMLQLNIMALTALTHCFVGPMVARGQGRILNLASTSAFQPVPTLAAYGASKAYVLSMTEALALELAGTGVTATALCPGFTETDMIARDDKRDMSLPLVANLSAEEVAKQGYAALMDGKSRRITGWGNKLVVLLGDIQPRPVQRLLGKVIAKRGF